MDWVAVHRALTALQGRAFLPELTWSLSPKAAASLQRELALCLVELDPLPAAGSTPAEVVSAVCKAADRCLSLIGEAEVTAVTAEVVREGLALLHSVLPPEASGCEGTPADALAVLERFGSDLDALAVQLFVSLCRAELVLAHGSWEAEAFCSEVKHYRALQGIAVWTLAVLARAVGRGRLTGRWLWEWSNCNPFSIFCLSKGLLSEGKVGALIMEGGLNYGIDTGNMPVDLQALQGVVLGAVLDLASPDTAFLPRAAAEQSGAEEVDISARNLDLQRHRSRLAIAAVECGFVEVLAAHLGGGLQPGAAGQPQAGAPPWPLRAAAFLAALASPVPGPEGPDGGAPVEEQCLLQGARVAFARELSQRAALVWLLLQSVPEAVSYWEAQLAGAARGPSLRGFLADCAAIAYGAPPSSRSCQDFLRSCLRGSGGVSSSVRADALALGCLAALAANTSLAPGLGALDEALEEISPDLAAQVVGCLRRWRGPVRAACLEPWIARATEIAARGGCAAAEADGASAGAADAAVCAEAAPTDAAESPLGLRGLLEGAPLDLCCALDKRLLVDPVRSPFGHAFERSVLERALVANGGRCPITGEPLQLDICPRVPELRKRAVQWVRQQRT